MARTGYRSRLTVEQGKIYWREVGKGPALVFLHSGWSDGNQWENMVSELSQHYRCYIPDLPGFGDSVLWSDQTVAISTLVQSFIQYTEWLHLRRFSLVGNGLGGWVAASYALQFPHAVHRLMLLEPEGVSLPNQRWFCRWGQRLSIQTSVWAGLLETCAPLGEIPGPFRDIKTLLSLRRQMMASPLSGTLLYARSLKKIGPEFLDNSLQRLLVPTLIMGRRGADSRKQILAERYAALCPMAQVALLPTEDEVQQAKVLAEQVYDFIESEEQYSSSRQALPVQQALAQATAQPLPPIPAAPRSRPQAGDGDQVGGRPPMAAIAQSPASDSTLREPAAVAELG